MNFNDYGNFPVNLSFSACHDEACASIPVVNDDIAEYDESFGIGLERTPHLDRRISLSSETAVLNIVDDDGK